jgi:hypothetical protein
MMRPLGGGSNGSVENDALHVFHDGTADSQGGTSIDVEK